MDISLTILIIGFAALVAAFFLPVIGLVYSVLMNSDIPCGVANSGKLQMVHGLFVSLETEFTREPRIANSTSRVDYQPHWDFKPDVSERRSALLRAEGLPYKMLFGHHCPPSSHYLTTEYGQSFAQKHNSLPSLQSLEPEKLESKSPNLVNSAVLSTNSGPQPVTSHSLENLQSQLPSLSMYQSTYPRHPLDAFCKNRFARTSRVLSSHLYTVNNINKDLNLRQNILLQVPDSQVQITKQAQKQNYSF